MKDQSVAIVTGSATGVGAAAAVALAKRGVRVVINYTKSEAEAHEAVTACEAAGSEALLVKADVSSDSDCRRLVHAAEVRWGRLDYLVNNAGTTKFVDHADLAGLSAEDFQQIYSVNVIGPFQMIRAAEPLLRRSNGSAVVNVSSVAGVMGNGSSIAYAASKGALNTMTLALSRVMGPQVRVNAVCPGFIESRWLREGLGLERYERLKDTVERATPLGAAATPEDVAATIIYLLLDARLVTGETVLVDAGLHLGMAPLVAR